MARRRFADSPTDPTTTLAEPIAADDTTVTLTDDPGSEMPTTGPFSITVGEGAAARSLDCASRAAEVVTLVGTAGVTFAAGQKVNTAPSKRDMDALLQEDDIVGFADDDNVLHLTGAEFQQYVDGPVGWSGRQDRFGGLSVSGTALGQSIPLGQTTVAVASNPDSPFVFVAGNGTVTATWQFPTYAKNLNTGEIIRIGGRSGVFTWTDCDRGQMGTDQAPMTVDDVIEVCATGENAIVLDGSYERIVIDFSASGVTEVIMPDPAALDGDGNPLYPDGFRQTIADGMQTLGVGNALILTDPTSDNQLFIWDTGAEVMCHLDRSAGLGYWTFDRTPSNSQAGQDTAELRARLATVSPLGGTGLAYSNGSLTWSSGLTVLDGVSIAAGDVILVKDQADATQNGVYIVVSSTHWDRVRAFDVSGDFFPGVTVAIAEGNVNADTNWKLATNAPITLDVTGLTFIGIDGADSRFDHFADASTPANTNQTDLYSDTLPAGILSANGDKIEAIYAGTFANNANTKRLLAMFGGTTILDTGALTGNAAGRWCIEVTVIRVSSSVVRCVAKAFVNGVTVTAPIVTYTEVTGLTLTNTQILKIAGKNGSNSADITARMGNVQLSRAA